MAKTYEEQLKDSRWHYVRSRVMERDNWQCCECRTIYNLQVHHKRYEKGRMAWEYVDSDLITLCDKCHEKVHREWGTIKPEDPLTLKLREFVTVTKAWKEYLLSKIDNG